MPPADLPPLTIDSASNFARITLACVTKEYPNSPGYVLNAAEDVKPPQTVHPAFYGCYDWHSSVNSTWMLLRLLKSFPRLDTANLIRQVLVSISAPRISPASSRISRPPDNSSARTDTRGS